MSAMLVVSCVALHWVTAIDAVAPAYPDPPPHALLLKHDSADGPHVFSCFDTRASRPRLVNRFVLEDAAEKTPIAFHGRHVVYMRAAGGAVIADVTTGRRALLEKVLAASLTGNPELLRWRSYESGEHLFYVLDVKQGMQWHGTLNPDLAQRTLVTLSPSLRCGLALTPWSNMPGSAHTLHRFDFSSQEFGPALAVAGLRAQSQYSHAKSDLEWHSDTVVEIQAAKLWTNDGAQFESNGFQPLLLDLSDPEHLAFTVLNTTPTDPDPEEILPDGFDGIENLPFGPIHADSTSHGHLLRCGIEVVDLEALQSNRPRWRVSNGTIAAFDKHHALWRAGDGRSSDLRFFDVYQGHVTQPYLGYVQLLVPLGAEESARTPETWSPAIPASNALEALINTADEGGERRLDRATQLRFRVTADQSTVAAGTLLELTFELMNVGELGCWASVPLPARSILRGTMVADAFTLPIEAGAWEALPRGSEAVFLAPGESTQGTARLRLDYPGTCDFYLAYAGGDDSAWFGDARSVPLRVSVTAPEPAPSRFEARVKYLAESLDYGAAGVRREQVNHWMGALDHRAVPALLEAIRNAPIEVPEAAVSDPVLAANIANSESMYAPSYRVRLLELLGRISATDTMQYVAENMLDAGDLEKRRGLGVIGSIRINMFSDDRKAAIVESLIALFEDRDDPDVRKTVFGALMHARGDFLANFARKHEDSPIPEVREAAARKIYDEYYRHPCRHLSEIFELLEKWSSDPSPLMRRKAASYLEQCVPCGEIVAGDAWAVIIGALKSDPDSGVQFGARSLRVPR